MNCLTHPEILDEGECSCERLYFPFYDGPGEDTLWDIDHVSPMAMESSCQIWLQDTIDDQTHPVPLADGRVLEPGLNAEGLRWEWPIAVKCSELRVLLVIRHWVEEPEDEQFGAKLKDLPAWRACESALRERPDAGWLRDVLTEASGGLLAARLHLFGRNLQPCLGAYGLPATIGTAKFMLKQLAPEAVGDEVSGATRGIMVTSLALEPRIGTVLAAGEVAAQIGVVSPWSTDELRRRAGQVATDHARWWKEVGMAVLPDLELRGGRSREPDALTLAIESYCRGEIVRGTLEEVALKRAQEQAGKPLGPDAKHKALRALKARLERRFKKNQSR